MRGSSYLKRQSSQLLAPSSLMNNSGRLALLRKAGARLDPTAEMFSGCLVSRPDLLTVGAHTFISYRCTFEGQAPITIGEHVDIAVGVTVLSSSHELGPSGSRAGQRTDQPVIIGNGAWIGAKSTILPGVTVGAGCVIGAGSLVTKDCERDGLYVGAPAQLVRRLD